MGGPESTFDPSYESRRIKWGLQIEHNFGNFSKIWYRARLVSESNVSHSRHTIVENVCSTIIRTFCLCLTIASTWSSILYEKGVFPAIRNRDVTTAFFQFDQTERLILYRPSPEASKNQAVAWKAMRKWFGEVEAGRFWQNIFAPWMCKNIPDLIPSIHNPAILFSESYSASVATCPENGFCFCLTRHNLKKRKLHLHLHIESQKRRQILLEPSTLSEGTMNDTLSSDTFKVVDFWVLTKRILRRYKQNMSEEQVLTLKSLAGNLYWIAICANPMCTLPRSFALREKLR